MKNKNIKIIIPAYNEQNAIGKVIKDIPKGLASEIIVVNNASTDKTEIVAREAGATVLVEKIPGYGRACLKGLEYLSQLKGETVDIVVFIDADYSDYPEEIPLLLKPILEEGKELVIGSRALGNRERGAMTLPQIFGNWLATSLLKLFYKVEFTDLGPFRAIKYKSLLQLHMQDKTFGWTVEMQLKAAKNHLEYAEVPVTYRKRIGISKISGTVKGTIMAGYKIIWTIFKYL
ncbi:glycosyltransferase family 2 protein [soil metagenome]